jgi:hypothetical protein
MFLYLLQRAATDKASRLSEANGLNACPDDFADT